MKKIRFSPNKNIISRPKEIALMFITLSMFYLIYLFHYRILLGRSNSFLWFDYAIGIFFTYITLSITWAAFQPSFIVKNQSIFVKSLFTGWKKYAWNDISKIRSTKIFSTVHTKLIFENPKKEYSVSSLSPQYGEFINLIKSGALNASTDSLTIKIFSSPEIEIHQKKNLRIIRIWLWGVWLISVFIALTKILAF